MVHLAGETAFVTGGTSGIATGLAGSLVAAGAKVAIADADESGLATAAEELSRSGGAVTAVRLDIGDDDSWAAAADAAEERLGPISIVCNVADNADGTATDGAATDGAPFRVCRWTNGATAGRRPRAAHAFLHRLRARGTRPHVLDTASVSGLVAMGLLVPGSVSTRVGYTAGVARTRLFGLHGNRRAADADHVVPAGASPAEVGRQIVEALPGDGYLIATEREWASSHPSTATAARIPARPTNPTITLTTTLGRLTACPR